MMFRNAFRWSRGIRGIATQGDSFIISAVGEDRPGIVNRISNAINEADASFSSSRMVVLGSHFTILAQVHGLNESSTVESISSVMKKEFPDFHINVYSARRAKKPLLPMRYYRLDGEGPDNTGILKSITNGFSELGISVQDLSTSLSSAPFAGYLNFHAKMTLAVPRSVDYNDLQETLRSLEDSLGFEIELVEME